MCCTTSQQPTPSVPGNNWSPNPVRGNMMLVYRKKIVFLSNSVNGMKCVPTLDCNCNWSEKQAGPGLQGQSVTHR